MSTLFSWIITISSSTTKTSTINRRKKVSNTSTLVQNLLLIYSCCKFQQSLINLTSITYNLIYSPSLSSFFTEYLILFSPYRKFSIIEFTFNQKKNVNRLRRIFSNSPVKININLFIR